ncbi:hypothetical protein C6P40_003352 [Pichia californica]|uniref:Bromo domain-containing protein n=1 Tax=Pichia californica TaxID=460514 RepID=A0A9P6WIL4_9ASCO|nr:hypothetical protein C6P40_003352 [[Candida] californica]
MPRSTRRGKARPRKTIGNMNHLDDSDDDDYNHNSKNNDNDNDNDNDIDNNKLDDEPSEEYEEDLRDIDVKPKLNNKVKNNEFNELKDLQNDSPLNSPKRNLRNRKDVNYTLPSPYLTEAQLEEMENQASTIRNLESSNTSPKKNRGVGRFNGGSSSIIPTIRRLYPTVGPFGGGEVQSIFQTNLMPSNLAALANAESSDSEDENDLIKPTDPNDINNTLTNIISTSTSSLIKKKNTLADTDPLGIDTNIDFSVIGGLNNYINQLKEMITLPLLYPEVYSKFHITPPRGVLFHGPPGTGKTLMARALAASCSSQNKKITFFMRKGADCLSKWVGEAERHLRLLFEEAKQNQPSIIFFDEIDGLAPVRSSKQEQIHASIVSTLLALMDGMDNRGQVIIIGATNRPDSIDPALRRPGRFDREFYFPLPDLNAREEILNIHMRKWDNKLDDKFIKELAILTKGYGGADLRALCTESALNSIQRSYPEIYKVNDKLKIDISKIKINSSDFTRALKKIIPNSARSTSIISEPLPDFIKPLLIEQFNNIVIKLENLLPMKKEIPLLEEAQYESLNNDFKIQQLVKNFDLMRTFKPRLGISGLKNQGLKYLSNAILNKLEGFTIQILDLSKLFSDSSISIENLVIQLFSELKRHKPSILFIPDTIGLLNTINESLKSTIKYLIRGINNNDKILIFCELEGKIDNLILEDIEDLFDLNEDDIILIRDSNIEENSKFFENFWRSIYITPNEYNDISIRPKKKIKKFEIIETKLNSDINNEKKLIKERKEKARNDMRLKNSLKVKLSGLLDIFKARYKRFKKPVIDDSYLIHLFDEIPDNMSNYQLKDDKILEISSGKLYYNIDLEVIEERLWNGYYSEPREFLNDLELILKDANVTGDRDRMLKANEMYAHAVVGVEEIEVQFPLLLEQWKDVARREKYRNAEALKAYKAKEVELQNQKLIDSIKENDAESIVKDPITTIENGTAEILAEEENSILKDTNEKGVNGNASEIVVEEDNTNFEKPTIEKENETQVQVQAQLQPGQVLNDETVITDINVEPVVLSEAPAKIELEIETKEILEEEKHDEQVDNDNNNNDDVAASAVAVSAEDDDDHEFTPEPQNVIVDADKVSLLKTMLLENTLNFKLTKLEKVNSKLCDIVWRSRNSLDKTSLLNELEVFISNLR